MLVLTRRIGQSIVIPGVCATITVIRVAGNRVQLGITAPSDIAVNREEVEQRQFRARTVGEKQRHLPR